MAKKYFFPISKLFKSHEFFSGSKSPIFVQSPPSWNSKISYFEMVANRLPVAARFQVSLTTEH